MFHQVYYPPEVGKGNFRVISEFKPEVSIHAEPIRIIFFKGIGSVAGHYEPKKIYEYKDSNLILSV